MRKKWLNVHNVLESTELPGMEKLEMSCREIWIEKFRKFREIQECDQGPRKILH